jgi:hypothetical protein
MKVIEAFRRHGLEVRRIDATTLGADSGVRFPLENLLAECHEMGRPLWDEVIDVHTRYMVEATRETDPSELSDEEFLAKVRERVVAPSLLAALDEYAYSRPLIDGIADAPRRALGLSYPGRTLLLADRHLADRDLDTAWLRGRNNTAAVPFDRYEEMVKDDIRIEVRRGDSIFLASKVADMPRLIADHLGEAPNGVLFAIPHSREIDYYRPREAEATVRAAELLAGLAHMLGRDSPAPVSPRVFFWKDGEFSQVADGYDIAPTGPFAQTLAELVGW